MFVANAADLGAALKQARVAKGLTQQGLADMLGVSRQWVASIEAGAPTARLGLALDALRCVDVLLETRADESASLLQTIPGVRA